MITIQDKRFKLTAEYNDYHYQEELTKKLDEVENDFDQNQINEIVLWKVNRYTKLDHETLTKLNGIKKTDKKIDKELTRTILKALLPKKGIQLPMASTILRFKNPKLYQIIDQRVYRIVYGENLNLSYNYDERRSDEQINIYLDYLDQLRVVSDRLNIKFELADRILYMADKDLNKDEPLRNY